MRIRNRSYFQFYPPAKGTYVAVPYKYGKGGFLNFPHNTNPKLNIGRDDFTFKIEEIDYADSDWGKFNVKRSYWHDDQC